MNEGGLVPTNIAEIMEKFNQSLRKFAIKETEWLVTKGAYENRISELEGQLKAHENINIDLLKRIKMLEYALSQER
jgi:striatin 1/3/4